MIYYDTAVALARYKLQLRVTFSLSYGTALNQTTFQKFGDGKIFKEIITIFFQQECIKPIKSESKDFYKKNISN